MTHAHDPHDALVTVASIPSPLGTLLVYADETGLRALDFPGARPAPGASPDTPAGRVALRKAAAALNAYFAKGTPLPTDLVAVSEDDGTPFQRKVWKAIARIPYGKTRSYAQLAKAVGKPGASRAVGAACGANPLPLFIPCHRVVASDGSLGGFSGGLAIKRLLLRHEGWEE